MKILKESFYSTEDLKAVCEEFIDKMYEARKSCNHIASILEDLDDDSCRYFETSSYEIGELLQNIKADIDDVLSEYFPEEEE